MEPSEHLDHLRDDGAALAAAARRAPGALVPSCPGWDMAALVGHAGGVLRWVNAIVAAGAQEYLARESIGDPPPPSFPAAAEWYDAALAGVTWTLAGANPDDLVWNWYDRKPAPARFWFRRMAQETAVHRWDAEAAAGSGGPIAPDLAVDGIDEFLTFVTRWVERKPIAGLGGSLHLHATDTEGEWFVMLAADHVEVRREHAKAGAALQGTASDLFLWLVNRKPADEGSFQVFGDRSIVDGWRNITF